MSYEPRIGMDVVCIAADAEHDGPAQAVIGGRYTIAEVLHYALGVNLQFTTQQFPGDARYLPGFKAECFRPVTKRTTSIAVFTALLSPSEDEIFREFEAAEFDYDENIVVPR